MDYERAGLVRAGDGEDPVVRAHARREIVLAVGIGGDVAALRRKHFGPQLQPVHITSNANAVDVDGECPNLWGEVDVSSKELLQDSGFGALAANRAGRSRRANAI